MTSVIGLDLGTECGWARLDAGKAQTIWAYGTWDCSLSKFDSPHIRFQKFERNLRTHLVLGLDHVFFEAVRAHKGVDAAHIYGAFLAKLQELCAEYDVASEGIPVGTVKKFATGKGNASKDEMVASVQGWGFKPSDHNAADAIAITRCGYERLR